MPRPGEHAASPSRCAERPIQPYEYVTSVVFPCAAGSVPPACNVPFQLGRDVHRPKLFRRAALSRGTGSADDNTAPFIRMAGQADYQRSSLTVNNGSYYMDTGASLNTQNMWAIGADINVFTAGQIYNVFMLYAKQTTVQNYSLYVGTELYTHGPDQLWVTRADKDGPSSSCHRAVTPSASARA